MEVNFNIPVTIYDCKESKDNPLYSYAKLKIFYVGMTQDKRLFTEKFSNTLLKTLPYVPVVGYFDNEKDDFVGHNEKQYIYGLVPENSKIEYIEEDDHKYAVCDIILYTGRTKDETGDIAQKIVGKSHSLELNPNNTKYVINKDSDGKLESIEFISGSLCGLSVLGDNETPAFEGSSFIEFNEKTKEIFAEFKTQIENFIAVKKTRGEEVENLMLKTFDEFIQKSYSEKYHELFNALSKEYKYQYFYIQEVFDDYVIIVFYNEQEETYQNLKILYVANEDGTFVFQEPQLVIARYYTEEQIAQIEASGIFKIVEKVEENVEPIPATSVAQVEENIITNTEAQKIDVTQEIISTPEEKTFSVNGDANNEQKDSEGNEEEKKGQGEFTSTALDNSEREELENFRREKKLNKISEFSEDLEINFLEKISKNVDNFSFEEIENNLSREFTRIKKLEQEKKQTKNIVNKPLYFEMKTKVQSKTTREEELEELIQRYKD